MVTIPMDIADLDRSLGRHEGHWRARCVECGLQYQLSAIDSVRIRGPKRVLDEFGQRAGEWRVDRHPRMLGDVTGNGRADIVGFGNAGVWVALAKGDGTFERPRRVLEDFGAVTGGWRVDGHPRMLADLTGKGRMDIVGFGHSGVRVALARGDGTFETPRRAIDDFGLGHGWKLDRHPRLLADVMGEGRMDIVGFGHDGVMLAPNLGEGRFGPSRQILDEFGVASGWRTDRHLRLLVDLTGDGLADILAFGETGVWISRNRGGGRFDPPELILPEFGARTGGWRPNRHPRFLADVTGNGRPDIVGFSEHGVWVSLNEGDGKFARPHRVVEDFGAGVGGWYLDRHPRFLADLTGDGRADIVGFGETGVVVAMAKGDGTFEAPRQVLDDFGGAAGWRPDRTPIVLADVTGNGRADIVGFGETGVHVAMTTLRPRNASVLVPLEESGEVLVKRRRPLVVGPRPFHHAHRRSHHHHHGFRGRRA
jgi:hypothetical protein